MFNKYTFKGNYNDFGYQTGIIFKDAIKANINKYIDLLNNQIVLDRLNYAQDLIKTKLPNCYEELLGKAEGSGVDIKPLILMHCPELIDKIDGCTTAIYKKDNCVLFSHNEDDKGYDHSNTALVKYIYEDGSWIVSLAGFDKLIGSCFGYNSKGLIFSCNFIYHEEIDPELLSRYIVIRDVIESGSIDECKAKLNKYPTASPFSFNVLEKDSLNVVNIENDFNKHYETIINYRYARSNHFLNKQDAKMSISSRNRNINAKDRIRKLNDDCNIEDLIEVLSLQNEDANDCILKDPNIFSDPSIALTICNFSYDSSRDLFIINDYIDHSRIELSYNEF